MPRYDTITLALSFRFIVEQLDSLYTFWQK